MQRQRDRYDILRNILDIVDKTQPPYRNYMNKMRIAYTVGLTHPQMVDYLGEFKPFYSYYEITERGRRCLQLFDELEKPFKT